MKQGLIFTIIVLAIFCAPVWGIGGDMGVGTEPLTDGSAEYPFLIEDLADFDTFAENFSYWDPHIKLAVSCIRPQWTATDWRLVSLKWGTKLFVVI